MNIESIRRDIAIALRQSEEYKLKIEQLELTSKRWMLEDFCMDLPNPIECSIDTLASGKTVLGEIKLSGFYSWLNPVKIEASDTNTTIIIEANSAEIQTGLSEVKLIKFPKISLINPTIVFKKGTPLNNDMVNIFQSTVNCIRGHLMLELAKKRIDSALDKIMNRVVKSTKI